MIHDLSGQDIHTYTVKKLNTSMDLGMQGYRMKNELGWDILLKAGSEQRGLTSVSGELSDSVHPNTLRGHLNNRFNIDEIWRQEAEQNQGLAASLPQSLSSKSVEIAVDFHDEPSYSRNALVQTILAGVKLKREQPISGGSRARMSCTAGNGLRWRWSMFYRKTVPCRSCNA